MNSRDEKPTTERMTVGAYQSNISDYLIYLFHVASYEFARPYCRGRRVLDFGSGTGYGAHALAPDCDRIVGVDISPDAVRHATDHYRADGLRFEMISPIEVAPLPFDEGAFDTVISFQVIEHVPDAGAYLSEIVRVLAPGGVFVCATPDRTLRLFPHQRPWNLYHLHEYRPKELERLLLDTFEDVEIHGMTAPPGVIDHELRRIRRTRLLTYPFTFPGAPEALRRGGLGLLKRMRARKPASPATATPPAFDFGHEVITISATATPSVNIVAVARRR